MLRKQWVTLIVTRATCRISQFHPILQEQLSQKYIFNEIAPYLFGLFLLFNQSINQSINQTSIAPISPAKQGSVLILISANKQ